MRTDRQSAQEPHGQLIERRRDRDFEAADAIRDQLRAGGWDVVDSAHGSELQAIKAPPSADPKAPPRDVTLLAVVHGWQPDAERWLLSVFTHCKADFEAVVVDNSGDVGIASWLDGRAAERLRVIRLDPPLGFGAAVNAGIEAAAGEVCVLFDQSVELKGDAITPLLTELDDPSVAVAGPFRVRAN